MAISLLSTRTNSSLQDLPRHRIINLQRSKCSNWPTYRKANRKAPKHSPATMQIRATSAIFLALIPIFVSAVPLNFLNPQITHAGTYHKGEDGKCVCRPKNPGAIGPDPSTSLSFSSRTKASRDVPDPVCNGACVNGADCIIRERTATMALGVVCSFRLDRPSCPSGKSRMLTCEPKAEGTKEGQAKSGNTKPVDVTAEKGAERKGPADKAVGQGEHKTGEQQQPAGQAPK
ncbi:hypothetical protein RB595_008861 [Gaeumannomyces hyphopodioides]